MATTENQLFPVLRNEGLEHLGDIRFTVIHVVGTHRSGKQRKLSRSGVNVSVWTQLFLA